MNTGNILKYLLYHYSHVFNSTPKRPQVHTGKLWTLSFCEFQLAESRVTGKPEVTADINLTSDPQRN